MGLVPAWRNSLLYTTFSRDWPEGSDLTVINAARQSLIQDMRIVEAIAPDSGSYINEVRAPHTILPSPFSYFVARP